MNGGGSGTIYKKEKRGREEPIIESINLDEQEDFDQENNPNISQKMKRSLADQASDYIQKMKNKNSFANNTDNDAPNANEENKSL